MTFTVPGVLGKRERQEGHRRGGYGSSVPRTPPLFVRVFASTSPTTAWLPIETEGAYTVCKGSSTSWLPTVNCVPTLDAPTAATPMSPPIAWSPAPSVMLNSAYATNVLKLGVELANPLWKFRTTLLPAVQFKPA